MEWDELIKVDDNATKTGPLEGREEHQPCGHGGMEGENKREKPREFANAVRGAAAAEGAHRGTETVCAFSTANSVSIRCAGGNLARGWGVGWVRRVCRVVATRAFDAAHAAQGRRVLRKGAKKATTLLWGLRRCVANGADGASDASPARDGGVCEF